MEKYINKDTIIENEIYQIFQSSVICPICSNIYIDPILCITCQKVYCKKCIENLKKSNTNNQHNCEKPQNKNSIDKNEILSKLKFYCVGCNKEIEYNNAEEHHNSCCPGKTPSNMIKSENEKKIFQKLTPQEAQKFIKDGREVTFIASML